MIGVTLGAGSGAGWTTLLIVLIFHQFFEGAALGARIALLAWISRMRAFVMGAAFMVRPLSVNIPDSRYSWSLPSASRSVSGCASRFRKTARPRC